MPRQRRVYLVPPARWKFDRSAASFDWSSIGPSPCSWAGQQSPADSAPNSGRPSVDWNKARSVVVSTALRCDAMLRMAGSVIPQVHGMLAAHRPWIAVDGITRRRALTALSFCAAASVIAVPMVASVAHSQPELGSQAKLSGLVTAKTLAAGLAPMVAASAPMQKTPFAEAHAVSHAAATATVKRPSPLSPSMQLLSDVSTMDLTMPIAEPDLNIASHHSLWAQVGKESGVDPLLLYSVALVESKSLHPGGDVRPTPWLFRVNDHLVTGERHHVQIEMAVATQFNTGVQDVGIMQVYYPMHRSAVRDPLTLLDPKTNISVAAKILHDGMHETRDPVLGVGYYHSHTPQLARDYGTAVMTVYQRLKGLYRNGKHTQVVAR